MSWPPRYIVVLGWVLSWEREPTGTPRSTSSAPDPLPQPLLARRIKPRSRGVCCEDIGPGRDGHEAHTEAGSRMRVVWIQCSCSFYYLVDAVASNSWLPLYPLRGIGGLAAPRCKDLDGWGAERAVHRGRSPPGSWEVSGFTREPQDGDGVEFDRQSEAEAVGPDTEDVSSRALRYTVAC